MSNHTPGPWHVTAMHKGIRPSFHSPGENGGVAICEMYSSGRDVVANARLIAAAPDLLEALEGMVSDFDGCYADGEPAMIKARAAIAKARGEA